MRKHHIHGSVAQLDDEDNLPSPAVVDPYLRLAVSVLLQAVKDASFNYGNSRAWLLNTDAVLSAQSICRACGFDYDCIVEWVQAGCPRSYHSNNKWKAVMIIMES